MPPRASRPPRATPILALLPVLVLVALLPSPAAAQGGLALVAGANYDELSDLEGEVEATFENAAGFHVGVVWDLVLGPLSIRPGVVYVDVGEIDPGGDIGEEVEALDPRLVEIPVDLRYRMVTPVATPYLLAGPVFRFDASDEEEGREVFEDTGVGGAVGFGLEVGLLGLGVFPEFRYQFGLSGFTREEFRLGDTTVRPADDPDLNALMIRVGVRF